MTTKVRRLAGPAILGVLIGAAIVTLATVAHRKPSVIVRQSGVFVEGVQRPEWVAQRATLAVQGDVLTNEPAAEGTMAGGRKAPVVFTDTLVKVSQVVKSLPPNTVAPGDVIRVRTLGGTIGRTAMASELYPTFTPGQKVLLFLVKGSNDPVLPASPSPYWALAGMVHGAFTITSGNAAVRPAVGDHYPLADLIKIARASIGGGTGQ